jgi:hypothetical protein
MIRFRLPATRNEWIALLLGLAVAVGSAIPLARGLLSWSWGKVDGVITYSEDKPGYRVRGVDIRYRYSAGGSTYNGDRYRFQFLLLRDRMESRDRELTLGRYRVGERVKVAVNPGDPSDSVLEPGPDLETLLPLGAGLLFILAGSGEVRKDKPAPKPEVYLGPRPPRYRTAKILAAIGCALLLFGAYNLFEGLNSLRWPTADGRILYSRARTAGTYETLLWYEYYVSGTRYLAGKYRTGGNVTPFKDVAVAAAKRYPAGSAVKVYYNPWHPGEALLEPGIWYGNFVAPAVAFLVLAAAWLAKKYAEVMAQRAPR